ncbi:hypothetical protein CYMTET_44827 [Cymbomonas tetramitiformis]|uniref:1-phosphatidylinositol 4-kinase n=1 Tax=Cymbomonas tetramitiformis TaxID=36881 RepID=A0AAE0C157_9CHLO|nr:hypothetical protein CYMTET_44827 [Cymbomonas tetramitiformis]
MNNPRAELEPSATGEGLRKGTRVGEGAFREVAAYILDHDNFSGVPPTTFATLSGSADINDSSTNTDYDCDGSEPSTPKQGSLQEFVRSISDCEEMGPSKYSVDEVHKITILDMRLGNTDRNGANILVSEMPGDVEQYKLIPIDHGYTLPHSLQDLSFEWEYWPQARMPYSEQSLEYISNLDADADLLMLAAHNIRLPADCQRVFRVCTLVLKKGAALGLVPASISECMTRKIWNQMSDLEKMSARALNVAVGKQTRASGRPSQLVTEAQEKRYFQELSVLLEEYFSSLKEENMLDNLHI